MGRHRRGLLKVAHLTTVDLSLRHLLLAQLVASAARGDDVVGVSAPGPDVAFLRAKGIRHRALASSTRSWGPGADLRAAHQLWRILRDERPDVLHTHNPKPGIYGRVIGRLARVPLVVHTTHGLYAAPGDRLLKQGLVYALEAVASRFSDVELVQNVEDLELMRRFHIASPKKLRYLGNGVDLVRFRPAAPAARAAVRQELGIDEGEIVVGLVARLVAEKGVPELLEAVAALGDPFRLLLIGPPDPGKADAVPAASLAAARRRGTILTGHRDDVEALYGAMDVFCLPSHREGFPRSAMEAVASGLPVVATDIRGCRQVVTDGQTGALVAVRDPTALASALAGYRDPRRRAEHGLAGRRKAEVEFDERVIVERVLAAHRTVVGR